MLSKDCLQLICEHITDIKTLLLFQQCSKTTFKFAQLQKKKLGYRFSGEYANGIEAFAVVDSDGEFEEDINQINYALRTGRDVYEDGLNIIDLTELNTGDIIYEKDAYRGTTTYAFYKNQFISVMDRSGYGYIPKKFLD